jgi:hypothetical protein
MEKEKTSGSSATRAKNKYNAKAYDRFSVTVPKGKKTEIDKLAQELGYTSRNEFIIAAINDKRKII